MADRELSGLTSHRNTHKPGLFGPKDFYANCRIQLVTFSTSDEQKTEKNHLETINRAGSVSRSPLWQAQLSAERTPWAQAPSSPGGQWVQPHHVPRLRGTAGLRTQRPPRCSAHECSRPQTRVGPQSRKRRDGALCGRLGLGG